MARHILLISSAGVVMIASSLAYSQAGQRNITRNANEATIPITSINACFSVESLETTAVIRMCAPRRSATTAPIIDSQRNSVDANSSAHTNGIWNT